MNVVWCHPAGSKLGNATMAWLFAYAHAKRVGAEFVCSPWIGEDVFALPKYNRPTGRLESLPVHSELNLEPGQSNVRITAYAQNEKAMIYTADDAREWLQLKRSIEEVLSDTEAMEAFDNDNIVCHLRRGDFAGYGYPLVSVMSYTSAMLEYGLTEKTDHVFISEETPTPKGTLPDALSFLPDFYRMVYAPTLLRANSSFSWVAGLLNKSRVLSPVVTPDMRGGEEHDCTFVAGNWPRLSCLEGCGDLRLKGEA